VIAAIENLRRTVPAIDTGRIATAAPIDVCRKPDRLLAAANRLCLGAPRHGASTSLRYGWMVHDRLRDLGHDRVELARSVQQ
jgi:hypothetical protein